MVLIDLADIVTPVDETWETPPWKPCERGATYGRWPERPGRRRFAPTVAGQLLVHEGLGVADPDPYGHGSPFKYRRAVD